jgi:hypothetical protein
VSKRKTCKDKKLIVHLEQLIETFKLNFNQTLKEERKKMSNFILRQLNRKVKALNTVSTLHKNEIDASRFNQEHICGAGQSPT